MVVGGSGIILHPSVKRAGEEEKRRGGRGRWASGEINSELDKRTKRKVDP